MELGKRLGEKIRKLRIEKKLSQKEVGKKIGADGRTLSIYENNKYLPSLETIVKLAEVLGVSIDYLLIDNSKKKASNIIRDVELMSLFDDVSRLKEEDKELVKRFVESFVVKSQLDSMMKK